MLSLSKHGVGFFNGLLTNTPHLPCLRRRRREEPNELGSGRRRAAPKQGGSLGVRRPFVTSDLPGPALRHSWKAGKLDGRWGGRVTM
jgi:hypothetical protein